MNKNIFKPMLYAIVAFFAIIACRNLDDVSVASEKSPLLVDLSSTKLVLNGNFPDNPVLTLYWSQAEYSTPTELYYKVEVSADKEFTKPVPFDTTDKSIRTRTYPASKLNTAATDIGLLPYQEGKMYFRVSSYIGSTNSLVQMSDITTLAITPYKVTYQTFYLVGAASYVGWNAGSSQMLFQQDSFSYIYTYMEKSQNFRFLGQQDWNPKNFSLNLPGVKDGYQYFSSYTSETLEKAADDTAGENMKFKGETGIYKIKIDSKTGVQSLEITKSPIPSFDIPQVYLVGNIAGNGWKPENAVEMTKAGTGIFEYTTNLAADTEFKFIGQKSWGDLEWANILKDNAGNSGFLGPKGDNGNIKFVGDGGSYKITINLKAGIYTIKKQ